MYRTEANPPLHGAPGHGGPDLQRITTPPAALRGPGQEPFVTCKTERWRCHCHCHCHCPAPLVAPGSSTKVSGSCRRSLGIPARCSHPGAVPGVFSSRFSTICCFFWGKKGVDPKLPPSSPLPVASPKRGCHFLHRPKEGVDVGHEDSFAFEELPAGAGFFCKRRSGTKSDTHPGTVLRPTENAPKSHRGYSVLQM